MREEVEKLSEGKSFEDICKIIYRFETPPQSPQRIPRRRHNVQQRHQQRPTGSMPSATAEGAEEV